MKKIVLRTSGYGLFLFLFLDALFLFVLLYFRNQFFSFQKAGVGDIAGLSILILAVIYLTLYIWVNRIQLTDKFLTVRQLNYGLPKITNRKLDLNIIKNVYIGNKKYINESLMDNNSWKTESRKFYKQFISHRFPGASDASRFALDHMDVFVICTKDDKVKIINTKPFSAAGFRKLIIELRQINIEVLVGSKILNRRLK